MTGAFFGVRGWEPAMCDVAPGLEPRILARTQASISSAESRFPASYAAIDSANADVDFYQPLSKAYLGMYELGCEGRSCSVIVMYDMLGTSPRIENIDGRIELYFFRNVSKLDWPSLPTRSTTRVASS